MTTSASIKSLHEKAVLVKFVQHYWSARKIDRGASSKVAKDYDTKRQEVATVRKWLVPREALKEASDIRREAYIYHMTNTLPWLDGGVRVTPVTALDEYLSKMRKLEAAHRSAVAKIVANYEDHIKEGMLLQGKMANRADYPSASDVARRFALDIIVLQLPATADWRIDVPKKQLEELRKRAELDLQDSVKEALRDLYQRLGKEVGHVCERLSKADNTFRDSLIGNLREVVQIVSRLNITADPELEGLRREVEQKLTKQSPEVLRTDAKARKQVAKDAADIMKKMSIYMGNGTTK